ncbi:MAG: TonB-dependent receptor [Kiritimatiellaeota bacterium]|nr:TonB-dependent receptor [Kiritimatiellota bacterium]
MKKSLYAGWWGAALLAGAALGQQVPNETPRLPPVVVTAPRIPGALDAQATPAAVTQWDRQDLAASGLQSLQQLPAATPNLALSHAVARSYGDIYAVRGIANTEFFSDPALAIYVDDAPMGAVFASPPDLLNIERMDIWRGPQGTRFGKNSPAGVIDITTRKPTDRYEADGSASYSTYNTQVYYASALGPLVPGKLRLSLTGGYSRSDGFLDNPLLKNHPDFQEGLNGRAYLGWTPAEDWDISLALGGVKYNDGVRLVPLAGDHRAVPSDINPRADAAGNDQALRIRRTLPGVVITSITTRRDFSENPILLDLDLSPLPGNTALIRQHEQFLSQEFRLQSPSSADVWSWRGGVFFSSAQRDGADTRQFAADPAHGLLFPVEQTTDFTIKEQQAALFGQLTYAGVDRLAVTFGARGEYTAKSLDHTKQIMGRPLPPVNADDDYFAVAPKLTIDYHLAKDVMVYASSGLGFKPGGFSAYIDPPKSPAFATERNWANEVGLKSAWLDNRLLANVACFYNDISHYQVARSITGTADLTIFNAPAVTARGVEVQLVGKPLAGVELSADFGYTDIQFDRFDNPETGASLKGKRPPYVPEFNACFAAQFTCPRGFFGRIEYQAMGRTFYDETNSSTLEQSGYGLVNARLGYEARRFSVCLFGENLADTDYFTKKLMVLQPAGVPGTPQTFGVMASVKY